MNPEDLPEFARRDAFPFWAIAVVIGVFLLLGGLLGYSLYTRSTRGKQVILDWRRLTPEQVRRIVIQPQMGEGRDSSLEPDPQSLGKTAVVIEDEDKIREIVGAIQRSQPSSGPSRSDFTAWKCVLQVEFPGHVWRCKVTANNRSTFLEFWSNGVSGWALGAVSSDPLTEIIPRVSGLKPPD